MGGSRRRRQERYKQWRRERVKKGRRTQKDLKLKQTLMKEMYRTKNKWTHLFVLFDAGEPKVPSLSLGTTSPPNPLPVTTSPPISAYTLASSSVISVSSVVTETSITSSAEPFLPFSAEPPSQGTEEGLSTLSFRVT